MPDSESDPSAPLSTLILAELRRSPGLKARELAVALNVERRAVSRCLTQELTGSVEQGADYGWRLVMAPGAYTRVPPDGAPTEIGRLCRYYLECIGYDMDEGASAFSRSQFGDPDYAELPNLPVAVATEGWFREPGVGRVLGSVRRASSKLVAWLGYPVRLRRHRTRTWEGYFVEPVLLWRIVLGENEDDRPIIEDDAPIPNGKFLRGVAMGDGVQVAEEAARLTEELGLNVPSAELPDADDLFDRLARVRPDWNWKESLDPYHCRGETPLAELSEDGIYNRAVVLPGERSPYTRGLESELKSLENVAESTLAGTALGFWLSGGSDTAVAETDSDPLIEVLPMNSEQRAAVRAALSGAHTVVTGPPGTGKSQVVTNLLVNAAWRGMKVLFASKNNKAVDVVEARVNGLGNRPVLLRLGSKEYQSKVAGYLTQLLAGDPGADERASYEESLLRYRDLSARTANLDRTQQATLDARNTADRLDAAAEDARAHLGKLAAGVDDNLVRQAGADLQTWVRAIDAADRDHQGFGAKLIWRWIAHGRLRELERTVAEVHDSSAKLGVEMPRVTDPADLGKHRQVAEDWRNRLKAAEKLAASRRALDVLKRCPSFEDLARQRAELAEEVADASQRLWRDWVQLAPTRLSVAQRKDVADYAATLQVLTGPDAERVHPSVRRRARELQSKVTELFACWGVTSLSARGRVPFEPGYFDLVVVDEASQCDVASVLPLLYRAKRSVIIGDPQQLRHISALSRPRDSELQFKHGLVDTRVGWMYSVSSLYDVAAGVASPKQIVNLRDHHRSHADIIEFSNRTFYEGRLRVATRYRHLKRPRAKEPGILWLDVKGMVAQPSTGGAQNTSEARAVVSVLQDLLVKRRYEGTVGVVTPFRAQAQLLQQLVQASESLVAVREKSELLVDTVHRFQGDERDVMVFSPVVSKGTPPGALSFLRTNGNLFNVAITRARSSLQVVGDQGAARESGIDYLANFAEYVGGLDVGKNLPSADGTTDLGAAYPRVSKPEQVSEWEHIFYRALYAAGVRPIPQFTVEQYDLDFAVIVGNRRLDIEVDGERYHRSWTGELCLRDQLRNQRLIELGWEVRRFWVYEVRDRLEECVKVVTRWVDSCNSTL